MQKGGSLFSFQRGLCGCVNNRLWSDTDLGLNPGAVASSKPPNLAEPQLSSFQNVLVTPIPWAIVQRERI